MYPKCTFPDYKHELVECTSEKIGELYEEKEESEKEEEEDGSSKVRVIHDMLVYPGHWVEYSKSLSSRDLVSIQDPPDELKSRPQDPPRTFVLICPKLTPNSSSNGGSPSYPSVPNAASQPVLKPPCSPMRPLIPAAPPNPPKLVFAPGYALEGAAKPGELLKA